MTSSSEKSQIRGNAERTLGCKWTIERFSLLDSRIKIYIHQSFKFESVQFDTTLWNGRLQGKQNSSRTVDIIYFHVTIENEKKGTKFKMNVVFCSTGGEILHQKKYYSSVYIVPIIIDRKDLTSKVVNDTLLVMIEVTCLNDGIGVHQGSQSSPMFGEEDEGVVDDPQYTCIRKTSNVFDELRNLWKSKENTDCVVSTGEQDIPVHSVVLGERSKVFASMLRHESPGKSIRCVKVTDCEKETIESMMEFVYFGIVPKMDFDLALKLLRVSDTYEVSDLKSYCSEYLMSILDKENVCQVLVSADVSNAEKLRGQAMEYFFENAPRLDLETNRAIFETRPKLLYDIILKEMTRRMKKTELSTTCAKDGHRKRRRE